MREKRPTIFSVLSPLGISVLNIAPAPITIIKIDIIGAAIQYAAIKGILCNPGTAKNVKFRRPIMPNIYNKYFIIYWLNRYKLNIYLIVNGWNSANN